MSTYAARVEAGVAADVESLPRITPPGHALWDDRPGRRCSRDRGVEHPVQVPAVEGAGAVLLTPVAQPIECLAHRQDVARDEGGQVDAVVDYAIEHERLDPLGIHLLAHGGVAGEVAFPNDDSSFTLHPRVSLKSVVQSSGETNAKIGGVLPTVQEECYCQGSCETCRPGYEPARRRDGPADLRGTKTIGIARRAK